MKRPEWGIFFLGLILIIFGSEAYTVGDFRKNGIPGTEVSGVQARYVGVLCLIVGVIYIIFWIRQRILWKRAQKKKRTAKLTIQNRTHCESQRIGVTGMRRFIKY